jgi:sialate O-acetylesterase
MKCLAVLFAALGALVATGTAGVSLPAYIGSGMVMQRDVPILVRGFAPPGEEVVVNQESARAAAKAGADGRWSVTLPPRAAGPVPDIVIEAGNQIVLTDLLAGDVWFAAGQSNMEFRLRRASGAAEEIPQANHPAIRFFKVGRQIAKEPKDDVDGQWQRCTPETAADFSAVAYFFARDLHKELGVPIGIISAAWGGTPGEAWMAPEVMLADPDYAALYAEWDDYRKNYPAIKKQYDADLAAYEAKLAAPRAPGAKPPTKPLSKPDPDRNHKHPGVLFNGMIHPLAALPLKGFLWYQGESNKDRWAQYEKLLTSLITDWRQRWGQGDLPFLIVQLANFKPLATEPEDSGRTRVREAQARVAQKLSACALVVTIDLGEAHDIHPLNKVDVGLRLGAAALENAYNRNVVGSGPKHRAVNFGDGRAVVEFDSLGGGLAMGPDGKAKALEGFALAGADKKWHWVNAVIEGDQVVVRSEAVRDPIALRYAWADNPPASLYNKEGLPAVPFRTDDWPLIDDASGRDGPPE